MAESVCSKSFSCIRGVNTPPDSIINTSGFPRTKLNEIKVFGYETVFIFTYEGIELGKMYQF